MKDQDFIVTNIPDYLKLVHEVQSKEDKCWFRGHNDVRFKLVPTLYRDSELIRSDHSNFIVCSLNTTFGTVPYNFARKQQQAFENFKKNGLAFVNQPPANDFEWLVLMQHYGGKTQLLDWTTNPLIALYFALSGLQPTPYKRRRLNGEKSLKKVIRDAVKNNEWINTYQLNTFNYSEFAVVYIINPLTVNDAYLRIKNPRRILDSNYKYCRIFDAYINYEQNGYVSDFPICVEAPKYDRRAYIQGSGFTLHGFYIDGLDWFYGTKDTIYKIFFPYKDAISMYEDLKRIYNITHSFVYQDLGNVVKDCYE